MSYNGIGLATVRGTATSGHVQYNAGHVRNSSRRHRTFMNANDGRDTRGRGGFGRGGGGGRGKVKLLTNEALKEGASSLALHEKKRRLEVRLLELRDHLEERGRLKEDDIDREVEAERKRTVDRWEREEKEAVERRERMLGIQRGGDENEVGEEGGMKLITETGEQKEGGETEVGDDKEPPPKTDADHGTNNTDNIQQQHPPRERRWENPHPPQGGQGRQWADYNSNPNNGDWNSNRRVVDARHYNRGNNKGGSGGQNAQTRQHFQDQRNARLRDAFGSRDNDKRTEGEAFDRELQQSKRDEKKKRGEAAEKENRKAERAKIRETRRDTKLKRREERKKGRDGDGGKKKKGSKRRGRSSSSSSSSSSRSYSSSSGSSSGSYFSSSSYSSDSRGRGRSRRDRGRRRRGGRSYSSRSSSFSSRSRSVSRDKKARSTKRGREDKTPPPKKIEITKSSRSASPDDKNKELPAKEGISIGGDIHVDSRPTSPGAPSPPVPPPSSNGDPRCDAAIA